jgi:hypothetical protein
LYILTFTFLHSRWEDRRLNRMAASVPRIYSALNIFIYAVLIYQWRSRYQNFATSSKDLFAIFMLYFCPVFWLRDINTYLVFCGFTSRPTSLLASNKASPLVKNLTVPLIGWNWSTTKWLAEPYIYIYIYI